MKLSIMGKGEAVPEFPRNRLLTTLSLLIPVLALLIFSGVVQAVDLMAPSKQAVKDTFGADSAIASWLILAEVVVGVIGYIRTKNIMLLFGVAVVVVFTSVTFSLVG